MLATYAAEKGIADLLNEARTPANGLPFSVISDASIYNYEPPDFSVSGELLIPTGVFVYFKESPNQDTGEMDQRSVGHSPQINIDMFVSAKSTEVGGEAVWDCQNVHAKCWLYAISVWNAVSHKQFEDKLLAKLAALGSDSGIGFFHFSTIKKLGVLPNRKSMRSIAGMRFVITLGLTETRGLETGVEQVLGLDFVDPYRREQDYDE